MNSNPAPAPVHIRSTDSFDMGMAAMALGCRPKFKFAVVDGDRRRLHDRTPRPALDLKIVQGGKS